MNNLIIKDRIISHCITLKTPALFSVQQFLSTEIKMGIVLSNMSDNLWPSNVHLKAFTVRSAGKVNQGPIKVFSCLPIKLSIGI